MPVYVFECKNGHKFDRFLSLKNYDKPQTCECGESAKRKIVATMVSCDMQPSDYYISPVSGKRITSYKQRKEDMKANGCVDYEPSMKKLQQERIYKEDKELEKQVEKTVEKEWERMPTQKREKLANELLSGADIELERR